MFRERKRRFANGVQTGSLTATLTPELKPVTVPVSSPPPAPVIDSQWQTDVANPFRRVALYFGIAAIYIRFSVIHEMLATLVGLNLYLLYLVMPPALLGVLATGGLRRTYAARASWYWLAFLGWLCIGAPFSSWRGGSFHQVYLYTKAEYLMFFVVAGLIMTWQECRWAMYAVILAAFTDLAIARAFAKQAHDRIDLAMGDSTISNSNDYAAHLILVMGFLLYLGITPKLPTFLRLICIPAMLYGVFLVLSSGSRGALVGLLVGAFFTFLMSSARQRMLVFLAVPIVAIGCIAMLPQTTLLRLGTLVSDSGDADVQGDAEGSSMMRRELLKKSIEYTFQHPLFGVGSGQFSSYEGGESNKGGQRGLWHETHNSFTQISSECGIPALLFFVAALVSAFRLALKTYKQARLNPANRDIAGAAFCVMLAMVGYLSAVTFANFGYRFYQLALCGFCIVIYNAAQHEMAARKFQAATTPRATPPWSPATVFSKQ